MGFVLLVGGGPGAIGVAEGALACLLWLVLHTFTVGLIIHDPENEGDEIR